MRTRGLLGGDRMLFLEADAGDCAADAWIDSPFRTWRRMFEHYVEIWEEDSSNWRPVHAAMADPDWRYLRRWHRLYHTGCGLHYYKPAAVRGLAEITDCATGNLL